MKVYHGIMGKLIQRLLWVFLTQRIEPYSCLYWTDDFVECTLSIQAEKLKRYGGRSFYLGVREQGIFQFDLCIEEDLFRLGKGRFLKAVYRDHAYTKTHLQEEHQRIHQWCNVVGLTANDYKLKSPKGKWMFYAGQMELSELKFLQTIGNILPTFDLLLSDNYQDSRGEGAEQSKMHRSSLIR